MFRELKPALILLLLLTLITGVVYPLLVTGIAQAVMPRPASGRTRRSPWASRSRPVS